MKKDSQYGILGVDADKTKVRSTFKSVIDNIFPGAWVNIIPDPYNKNRVVTQHQDGDGSKSVQRLLNYFVTGDAKQLGYMVDDALSMNTADVAASGFVFEPWIITQVLNSNLETLQKGLKEIVMEEIRNRWRELRQLYEDNGFRISFLGGETADLPDQVRSSVFDMTVTAWAKKKEIIRGNVQLGDKIWGFLSDGKASWEKDRNSGFMANGSTLARSVLMHENYNEIYCDLRRSEPYFKGRFRVKEKPEILKGMTVSEALLSPTRQWAIVIRKILEELRKSNNLSLLHGISINTGGGATKIKNLGEGGIIYVKNMPEPPPIFQLIQQESGETWRNMFKSFNCGIGIDVVGENNKELEDILLKVAMDCRIGLSALGECGSWEAANTVVLKTPYGRFEY